MSENVYERLRALLDRQLVDCPPAPEVMEILKALFTPEEAKVAVGLGFRPFTVEEIASRAGVDPQKSKHCLESLADKGAVFARKKAGEWGYALPTVAQIVNRHYMRGIQNETTDKITPLWKKYSPSVYQSYGSESTSFTRIIPIQEEIEHIPEILPYERIHQLIGRADSLAISHCACRELHQNCDAPREACMIFDETATYLVERGFARNITKEEMKEKLKEFDKAGLVHQVSNSRDRLAFVCSCCSCCCGVFRTLAEQKNPHILTRSAFVPVLDADRCTGCAVCSEERCPMKAIEMEDKTPVVDMARCIGCGLCATGCPSDARRMEKSIEVPEPPSTPSEMGERMLKDRGKLGVYLELTTPTPKEL